MSACRLRKGQVLNMIIRKTTVKDIDNVMRIYADARDFMRESGNPDQWHGWYPPRDMIERDVRDGTGYVCEESGQVLAVFYFNIEKDPTYEKIDGGWLNDEPYGVVHRIARCRNAATKGAGTFCINWCFEQIKNIRIDTHENNLAMRGLLDKLGFTYCGIIWVLEGTEERIAFQKSGKGSPPAYCE